jgi:aromatic-L-amino-acid decarboxylase
VEGYRAHIRKVITTAYISPTSRAHTVRSQSISLGEIFADSVRDHPELLELVTPPSFALSVFRIAPAAVPDLSADRLNALNEQYYQQLYERKDLALTQTMLNDVHCVR